MAESRKKTTDRLSSKPTKEAFRPDIEGLRGIAVLLVVAFHAQIQGAAGGFIGVDVFFVLSGYLITALLIKEFDETGRIDMCQFYARRARRLLPASALVVGAILALGPLVLAPRERVFIGHAARSTALYLSNIFCARNAADYFAPDAESNPLLHTWSLAVEEQFYLVWPILLLLCLRQVRSRRTLLIAISIVSALSLGGSISLTKSARNWAFYGSHTRAWEFGMGALASQLPLWNLLRKHRCWAHGMGWLGFFAIIGAGIGYRKSLPFPGAIALVPVLGTVLVLAVGAENPRHPISRFLSWRGLQWLGRHSYSWYLWHWPVLVGAGIVFPSLSPTAKVMAAIGALGVAATTHRLIENPIRFHRSLIGKPMLTLSLAFLLTIGNLSVSQYSVWSAGRVANVSILEPMTSAAADLSAYPSKSCFTDGTSPTVLPCTFGAGAAARSVALFGDSHAAQWFDVFRGIAERHGWRLLTLLKSGCPAADVVYAHPTLGPQFATSCTAWRRDAINRLVASRPTLVVVGNSMYVSTDGERDGHDVSLDDWQEGTRRTLGTLDRAGLRVLQLQDNPRATFDIPTCLARVAEHSWYPKSACTLKRDTALPLRVFHAELTAARGLRNIDFIETADSYCQGDVCPAIEDGLVRYQDSNHLSAMFMKSLSPIIERRLMESMSGIATGTNVL